jgi:hypothetical protein
VSELLVVTLRDPGSHIKNCYVSPKLTSVYASCPKMSFAGGIITDHGMPQVIF